MGWNELATALRNLAWVKKSTCWGQRLITWDWRSTSVKYSICLHVWIPSLSMKHVVVCFILSSTQTFFKSQWRLNQVWFFSFSEAFTSALWRTIDGPGLVFSRLRQILLLLVQIVPWGVHNFNNLSFNLNLANNFAFSSIRLTDQMTIVFVNNFKFNLTMSTGSIYIGVVLKTTAPLLNQKRYDAVLNEMLQLL